MMHEWQELPLHLLFAMSDESFLALCERYLAAALIEDAYLESQVRGVAYANRYLSIEFQTPTWGWW